MYPNVYTMYKVALVLYPFLLLRMSCNFLVIRQIETLTRTTMRANTDLATIHIKINTEIILNEFSK